jgi:hypothetical protein
VDAVDDIPHKLLVGFVSYSHPFAVPHDAFNLVALHGTDELHLVHVHV